MKALLQFKVIIIFICVVFFSCKQPYNPLITDSNASYLVVDGIINTGNDSTIIKLSRTVNLSSRISTRAEEKAKVTVETDGNTIAYTLNEIKAGVYVSMPLKASKTAKYRLRIITADNKIYLSDFVPVKVSPAIDSITYDTPSNGLQIYANTHDDAGNIRYYRWEYVETWKFHSGFSSSGIWADTAVVMRNQQTDNIFFCWGNNNSSDIVLASSAKLTNDVIYHGNIAIIPAGSEKLSLGYSILVKQYALTEEAFNFWQNVKKNTEQLGSIFDAQPSQMQGNIHNINNLAEPVFGYISAGTLQQQRLIVLSNQLPRGWGLDNSFYAQCQADSVFIGKYLEYFAGGNPREIPVEPIYLKGILIGYTGSSAYCVDCRLRGTNKRPVFWPANN